MQRAVRLAGGVLTWHVDPHALSHPQLRIVRAEDALGDAACLVNRPARRGALVEPAERPERLLDLGNRMPLREAFGDDLLQARGLGQCQTLDVPDRLLHDRRN